MYEQTTLSGIASATSSPASVDGASPPASPAGPTTANSGPARRRASRSASPGSSTARRTSGTCGPTTTDCSVPAGPLSQWENRLRQRLATRGSTECSLIWKASVTPAGRSLCRLVPSMRPIAATGSGSSPALWATPSARDWKDTPGMATKRPDGRSRIDQLPRQVAAVLWPTPTAADARRGSGTIRPQDTGIPLPQRVAQVLGPTLGGLSATTGKRVASPALNPEFTRWLMGFPPAWGSSAPTAMPSSRKSRPK